MSSWIGAIFLVVGFIVLMRRFGLVRRSRDVFAVTRSSLDVIRSSSLNDDVKEAALQKDAKKLLGLFLVLASGGAVAAFLPVGVVWVLDRVGWVSLDSVLAVALSPLFLIVSGILILLSFLFARGGAERTSDYSTLDRCLHRVAFKTAGPQIELSDLEDRLFARQLAECPTERPVFITGLPRAGTTLLLECLAGLPEFASHGYRDMPFVLIPCLWNRFSASFQKAGRLSERAHGDGVLIDFDSPEALEEMIWKPFWKKHYLGDRIRPWGDESNSEFALFFKQHMRKVVLLRRAEERDPVRYISKNNLNIARTHLLRGLFPDSTVVVPFREPLCHVHSLKEQHERFTQIHHEDPFAKEYMQAVGHYDFGANLRPVDFDGWFDARVARETASLDFWLEYWVAAYGHLLGKSEGLCFFDFDDLCREPAACLRRLAATIDSRDVDAVAAAAARVKTPRMRDLVESSVSAPLLRKAREVHAALQDKAGHPYSGGRHKSYAGLT